ncbi:MAG: hypothetical protein WC943_06340 [Elusimicrobiota bacterium]|jgi:hypothetical protein
MSPWLALAIPCVLLFSMSARAASPSSAPASSTAAFALPPVAGESDATGQTVSPEARTAYQLFLNETKGRDLSEMDYRFVLTVLNQAPIDPGTFRNRAALMRYFAEAGVRVGEMSRGGMTDSDLWRLARAARAAAVSFRIPPAVLMCLTFCESRFNRRASAWTTSAKGMVQMTNPAVEETIKRVWRSPSLKAAAESYAAQLGASIPSKFVGAPDVDALTKQLDALVQARAPASEVKKKQKERQKAIRLHKDQAGHIYNIETNFGLAAAYLSYLRYHRLSEVPDERKGWLTAVGAYNQGIGYANMLIKAAGGPKAYNGKDISEVFSREAVSKLPLPPERRQEMLDEIHTVRRCAIP